MEAIITYSICKLVTSTMGLVQNLRYNFKKQVCKYV